MSRRLGRAPPSSSRDGPMPSPALRAREQDTDGDGAAEASLRDTMRRAGVRAPVRGERQPACGRPGDGRWLTGFKDLWLTGPLTAPKRREIRRFQQDRAALDSGQ